MTFVEAWQSSESYREVAEKLGKPYTSALGRKLGQKASIKRAKGITLKRFKGSGNYGGYPPNSGTV